MIARGLGSYLFSKYFSRMPMRQAFFRIQIVLPFTAMLDIALAQRWNIAVGINDHLLGGMDTIAVATASNIKMTAVYTLVTKICPPKVEATLFSWIMGFQFTGSVSRTMTSSHPSSCL